MNALACVSLCAHLSLAFYLKDVTVSFTGTSEKSTHTHTSRHMYVYKCTHTPTNTHMPPTEQRNKKQTEQS